MAGENELGPGSSTDDGTSISYCIITLSREKRN